MLGARIAALRRRCGISQAELARRLQCSASAVGMYEQGRREPGADLLVKLADQFGVTTDYLLTGRTRGEGDRDALAESLRICLAGAEARPRQDKPFTRQELAVLLAALLTEP